MRQEQEDTEALAPIIHHRNPNDLILNCSQMRSAMHFEHFRTPAPSLDREWAILQGAAREIHTQAEKGKKKTKASRQNNPSADGPTRAPPRISVTPYESQFPAPSSQSVSNHRTSGPSGLLRNMFTSRMDSRPLPMNPPAFRHNMHHSGQLAPSPLTYRQNAIREHGVRQDLLPLEAFLNFMWGGFGRSLLGAGDDIVDIKVAQLEKECTMPNLEILLAAQWRDRVKARECRNVRVGVD